MHFLEQRNKNLMPMVSYKANAHGGKLVVVDGEDRGGGRRCTKTKNMQANEWKLVEDASRPRTCSPGLEDGTCQCTGIDCRGVSTNLFGC